MRPGLRLLTALLLSVLFTGLPGSPRAHARAGYLPGFPTLKQTHSLTCESSAASMATRGHLTEDRIMAALPRSPNPNLGFRGSPTGEQGTTLIDYGVYAAPIQKALARYGYRSDLISYGKRDDIMASIDKGWPVVAWVTYSLQRAVPRLAYFQGEPFFLVPHEHAVLVVGYDGAGVIANDPWIARQVRYDWGNFRRAWGYFGDMALSVEPCPLPSPVSGLRVSALSASGITWTWQRSQNAIGYQVQVIRHAKRDLTVFQGVQKDTQYTLPSPVPDSSYEILVQTLSGCGSASSPTRLFAQVPVSLYAPTSTATPAAEGTLGPTPSGSVTPTGTSTAGATSTPVVGPTPAASPTPKR